MSTIKLRRDTAQNWLAANPVLALGEPGLETDTGYLKIGDGNTEWSSLGYSISNAIDGTGGAGAIVLTDVGTIRIGDSDSVPVQLNPPHVHIRVDDHMAIDGITDGRDFFFGDDDQFLRLASDGATVLQARIGSEAPTIITGAPTAITLTAPIVSVTHGRGSVPIVTVSGPIDLQEDTKVYIEGVSGDGEWEDYLNGHTFYAIQVADDAFEIYNNLGHGYTSTTFFNPWDNFGGSISVASLPGDVLIVGSADTTDIGEIGSVYIETAGRGKIEFSTENGAVTVDQYGAINLTGNGIIRNQSGNTNISTWGEASSVLQWFDNINSGDQPWNRATHSNYLGVDYAGSFMGNWDNNADNNQLLLTRDGRLRLWRQSEFEGEPRPVIVLSTEDSVIASRESITLKSKNVYVQGNLDLSSTTGWATEIGGPVNSDGSAPYANYTATYNADDFVYAVGLKYRHHTVAQNGVYDYNDHIITKFDKTGSIVWSKTLQYIGGDPNVNFRNSSGFTSITPNGPGNFWATLNFEDAVGVYRSINVSFDQDGNQPFQGQIVDTDSEGGYFYISDATVVGQGVYVQVGNSNDDPAIVLTTIAGAQDKSTVGYLYAARVDFTDRYPDFGYYEDNISEYYVSGNGNYPVRVNYVNCFGIKVPNSLDRSQVLDLFVKKDAHTGEISVNDWGPLPTGFEPNDTYIIPGAWISNNTTQLGVYASSGSGQYGGAGQQVTQLYFDKSGWPNLTVDLSLTTNPIISARCVETGVYFQVTSVGSSDPDNWYVNLDRVAVTGVSEIYGDIWQFEVAAHDITLVVGQLDNYDRPDPLSMYFTGTGDTDIIKLAMDTSINFYDNTWVVTESKGEDALVVALNSDIAFTLGADDDDGIACVTTDGTNLYVGGYSYNQAYEGNNYVGAVAKLDSSNNIVWQKKIFDDGGAFCVTGIALDKTASTVFVTGRTSGYDLLVASFDAVTGYRNWLVRLFADDPIGISPGADPVMELVDNDLLIVAGGTSLVSYGYDLYVIRLETALGQVQWMRQLGTNVYDFKGNAEFSFNSLSVGSNTFTLCGSTDDRFGESDGDRSNAFVISLPLDGSGMGTYPIDPSNPTSLVWDYRELEFPNFGDWAQAYAPNWEMLSDEVFDNLDLNWTKNDRLFGASIDNHFNLVTDLPWNWTTQFTNTGLIQNVSAINFDGGAKLITHEEGLIVSAPATSEYAGLWYGEELDNGPLVAILAGSEAQEDNNPGNDQIIPEGNKATIYVEGNSWYFDDTGALRLPGDVTDVHGNSIILTPGLAPDGDKVNAKNDIEMFGNYQGVITTFGKEFSDTGFIGSVLDSNGLNTYILGSANNYDDYFVLATDKLGNELWRQKFDNIDSGNNNYEWYPDTIKLYTDNSGTSFLYVAGNSWDGSQDGFFIASMFLDGTISGQWKQHYDQGDLGGLDYYDFDIDQNGNPIVVGRSSGDRQVYSLVEPIVVPTAYSVISGGSGYKSSLVNVAVTGGSGSSMTVDIASNGVSVTAATVNAQGMFYLAGDTLYVQHTADTLQTGYNFVGDWSAPFGASLNDVVNYNGQSYVCSNPVYGSTPPDADSSYINITASLNLTAYYGIASSEALLVVNIADVGGDTKTAPWRNNDWQVDIDGSGNWQTPVRLNKLIGLPTYSISGSGTGLRVTVGYDTISSPSEYAEVERVGFDSPVDYTPFELVAVPGSLLGGIDTVRHLDASVSASNYVLLTNTSTLYINVSANPSLGDVTAGWFVIDGSDRFPITSASQVGGNWMIICTGEVVSSTVSLDNGGNDCVVTFHDGTIDFQLGLSGRPVTPTTMTFVMDLGLNKNFSTGSYNIRRTVGGEAFIWTNGWQTSWGGTGNDYFRSVAYNKDNLYSYAAGEFFDTTTDTTKHVVMCFDHESSGSVVWSKAISDVGGSVGDVGTVVYDWDNANLFLVSTNGQGFTIVTRLNRDTGEKIWQVKAADVGNQDGNSWYNYPTATIAGDGGIILGGTADAYTSNNRVFLYTKIDRNGNHVWSNYVRYPHYNGAGDDLQDDWTDNGNHQGLSTGGNQFAGVGYYYNLDANATWGISVRLPTANVWDLAIYNAGGGLFSINNFTNDVDYYLFNNGVVSDITITSPETFSMSSEELFTAILPFTNGEQVAPTVIGNANPGLLFNDGSVIRTAGIQRSGVDNTGDQTWSLTEERNGTFLYFYGESMITDNSRINIPPNDETPLPIGYTVKAILDVFDGYSIAVYSDFPEVQILASGVNPGCNNWLIGGTVPGVYTITKIDTNRWIIEGPYMSPNC